MAAAVDCRKPTYSAGAYWDSRYTGPAKNFDWFFNYPALKELFRRYLPSGRVLHVGCGNSNIQEGMAADGFTVTNVDISPVVIEQMQHQHADIHSLEYIVADCRDMSQLDSGSFQSCIDKGTLDAILCSQSGQADAVQYFHEIGRLLQPGGTFLLISLGDPSARAALLQKEHWCNVEVLLLPKPLLYLQSDASLTGRPLPPRCAADKNEPIEVVGPWPAAAATEQLSQQKMDARDYFFAYICTKPPHSNSSSSSGESGSGAPAAGEAPAAPAVAAELSSGPAQGAPVPPGACASSTKLHGSCTLAAGSGGDGAGREAAAVGVVAAVGAAAGVEPGVQAGAGDGGGRPHSCGGGDQATSAVEAEVEAVRVEAVGVEAEVVEVVGAGGLPCCIVEPGARDVGAGVEAPAVPAAAEAARVDEKTGPRQAGDDSGAESHGSSGSSSPAGPAGPQDASLEIAGEAAATVVVAATAAGSQQQGPEGAAPGAVAAAAVDSPSPSVAAPAAGPVAASVTPAV